MGWGAAIGLIATGVSMYGQKKQAEAQQDQLEYQAEQVRADADATVGASKVQAEKIRKVGKAQASAANASLAASGVDVNAGTADTINRSIMANTESDALTELLNGVNKSKRMQSQADALDIESANVGSASKINMTATALGGAAKAYGSYSNWKTAAAGSKGA